MEIIIHTTDEGISIAEAVSGEKLIRTTDDGLNFLGDLYYQGFDRVILQEHHFTSGFFDLKNGMAGEILQKFSNYRVKLAIVGSFADHTGKSITDFMRESNRAGHIHFSRSREEALLILSDNRRS